VQSGSNGLRGDIPGFFHRYRAQRKTRDDIAKVPGVFANVVVIVVKTSTN
jgi:hypothetical protein